MSLLPERRHEILRVEAFSDAVFAFALTLLVVALDVPTTYEELMKLMAGFAPFACSFALLSWIWYEHNIFFRTYGLQDAWIVTINSCLLFVVLFYVYPLKFLFTAAFSFFIPALRIPGMRLDAGELANIFAIYGIGFVAIFLILGLLYLRAYRLRDVLGLNRLDVFDVRVSAGHHMVSAGVGLFAVGLAVLAPSQYAVLSGFSYFLMGPVHGVYGTKTRKRRQALALKAGSV